MQKLLFLFFLCGGLPLAAAPVTEVSVTHPTTTVKVLRPTTSGAVSRPVTVPSVQTKPVTTVEVIRPVTPGAATRQQGWAGGKGTSAPAPAAKTAATGSSYTPSYKQAKKLDAPKAAGLGAGSAGLGGMTSAQAAQKDRDAQAFESVKGESSQLSIDDVLKKTKMPEGLASKLKQRNFEAAKMNNKK